MGDEVEMMTKKDLDIIAACIGAAQAEWGSCLGRKAGIDDLSNRLIVYSEDGSFTSN